MAIETSTFRHFAQARTAALPWSFKPGTNRRGDKHRALIRLMP